MIINIFHSGRGRKATPGIFILHLFKITSGSDPFSNNLCIDIYFLLYVVLARSPCLTSPLLSPMSVFGARVKHVANHNRGRGTGKNSTTSNTNNNFTVRWRQIDSSRAASPGYKSHWIPLWDVSPRKHSSHKIFRGSMPKASGIVKLSHQSKISFLQAAEEIRCTSWFRLQIIYESSSRTVM